MTITQNDTLTARTLFSLCFGQEWEIVDLTYKTLDGSEQVSFYKCRPDFGSPVQMLIERHAAGDILLAAEVIR